MKTYLKLSIAFLIMVSLAACSNKRERQVQYMPDMYVSVPYDTDGPKAIDNDDPSNRKPVAGTVPRGKVPYEYANTTEAYDAAKANLKSPLASSEKNLENGKKMYEIYCISCHGKKGDGNGYLSQQGKFEGIPNYKDRDINEGSIYHVIMHGKNLMGSHASQLTQTERWQVVQYVEQLRNDLLK